MAYERSELPEWLLFPRTLIGNKSFFADFRLYGIPAGILTFLNFEYMLVLNKDMLI
mgnify:CR=1 FL=1